MSEATSKTCEECGGRGFRGVKGGLCATCNGTGITTTGEVVGTPLPRWPEVRPIREESGARAMSDKATTTTCSACGGTGFFDARHYDRFCPTCEGTGTAPKGNSPENPESSPKPALDSRATLTDDGAKGIGIRNNVEPWTPAAAIERLNATIAEQAAEIEKLKQSCAGFLRSIASQETDINHRDARINEQAAEIERLRERVNGLEQLHASWADGSLAELTAERDAFRAAVDHLKGERDTLRSALEIAAARSDSQNASISYFEQESASHNAALAEVTTERDSLRLENQRLKDASFEAQDRYAALEAERDALKRNFASLVAATEQGVDRIRAEKYLAVIAAQNEAIAARIQCHEAEITAAIAAHEAGLSLSRDPKETPMTDERGER